MYRTGDKVRVLVDGANGAAHPTERRDIRSGDIITVLEDRPEMERIYYEVTRSRDINFITYKYIEPYIENESGRGPHSCACPIEQLLIRGCTCFGL